MERIRLKNLSSYWMVPLLLFPVVFGVGLFAYYPAWEAIYHSFYRWDGRYTEEFVGLEHFRRLMGDLSLWGPLLLGSSFVGLAAVVDQVKAKFPLRIFGFTVLLFAAFRISMDAKELLFTDDPVARIHPHELMSIFIMVGISLFCLIAILRKRIKNETPHKALQFFSVFLLICAMGHYLIGVEKSGDALLWKSFNLIIILVIANFFKMWPSIFTAVCIHRLKSDRWQYLYRVLFVVPMIIPQMVGLLIWKFFYDPNVGVLNKTLIATGLDNVLIWLDKWVLHLGVFQESFNPAWLGNEHLIISALIFWGFPWVGVVGVLIYLSGLQNIGNDVYEASDIDGVGWWGRFWYIELPLIMTQIRLNLVLMIIGTFQAYGFQLILLGAEGGPGNKGLTPGLYMYFQAFQENSYGLACAIGLMLFFIILVLTIVNQKYVRVDK